jgi:subtilase family serine protease
MFQIAFALLSTVHNVPITKFQFVDPRLPNGSEDSVIRRKVLERIGAYRRECPPRRTSQSTPDRAHPPLADEPHRDAGPLADQPGHQLWNRSHMSLHATRATTVRRGLAILGAAVLAAGLTTMTGYSAAASPGHTDRTSIPGSSPAWTASAQAVGSPASSQSISFRVVLRLRDSAGAEKLAARVSNPKSADYAKYLSAAQFNARFAPTSAQVDTVRSFLASQGIAVTGVAAGNRWINASGTVAQIQTAFATTVKTYNYKGRRLRGTPAALSVPSSVAGLISGVTGVSQTASLARPDHVTVKTGTSTIDDSTADGASPNDALPPRAACSAFWDQHEQVSPPAYGKTSFPTPNCGYTPAQLRTAYGIQSAVSRHQDGTGVNVAIIDAYASATILQDANDLAAFEGEPQFAPGQYSETIFGPFNMQDVCQGEDIWNEEESLDVQAVHSMAPGANIHYLGAQNCDAGLDDAMNYVVQNHVANIVSDSWGDPGEDGLGDEVSVEHSIFLQGALEGIGFYFSSGDSGDNVAAGAPHPEPDYPASDPLVTGVGGTSLALTSSNSYLFETSWGIDLDSVNFATSPSSLSQPLPGSFIEGGGGGVSALFTEPIYQRLAVPRSLATLNGSTPMRVVPDVAAVGDPETGFLIDFGGGLGIIGGTSLAAPVFSGIQAVASQYRRAPIGFANPLLYVLGLTRLPFHDVTAPASPTAMMTQSGRSLLTMGQDSSLTSTRGYDDTTGLGTPNGAVLLLGEGLL